MIQQSLASFECHVVVLAPCINDFLLFVLLLMINFSCWSMLQSVLRGLTASLASRVPLSIDGN